MISIEHRMKTIDIIDKLILEAANKGYNILDYEYNEPNDSKKHNFFIELRYDSVKHMCSVQFALAIARKTKMVAIIQKCKLHF